MLKLWDITKGMTLQNNKGEISVVSEVNEKVIVNLEDGKVRKICEGSLKNWQLVVDANPTNAPISTEQAQQVKEQNAEVQLHQQTEENVAGGEILDTNKLETNKKRQIEPSS